MQEKVSCMRHFVKIEKNLSPRVICFSLMESADFAAKNPKILLRNMMAKVLITSSIRVELLYQSNFQTRVESNNCSNKKYVLPFNRL
jgi:hypothetical protein